jgi:tryptophan synthase beta chain
MQDEDGQTLDTTSISAGLDYPGVGPEHSWLRDTGRATYSAISDAWAMQALEKLARAEGILCAIETAHAVHGAVELARELGPDKVVLVCLSGRGDKDMDTAARWFDLLDPNAAT